MSEAHADDQPSKDEQAQTQRERMASAFGQNPDAQPLEHHIDAASQPWPAQHAQSGGALTSEALQQAFAPLEDALHALQARVAALEERVGRP